MAIKTMPETTKKITKSGRILIVDDDRNIATTLAEILEHEKYTVSVAFNLNQATDLIERQRFDAAVVDLRLDRDNGLDLLAAIDHSQSGHCSMIVLTGYGSLETAQEAIRAQAYDYLTKPCDPEEFKASVARAVERASFIQELEARVAEVEQAQIEIEEMAASREEELNEAVISRTKALEDANAELRLTHQQLEEQVQQLERARATVLELSAPGLRIRERLLLFPLIGFLDDDRIQHLNDHILNAVNSERAEAVVLDFTGLAEVNDQFASRTSKIINATRLLGAVTVITGLSAESCDSMVKFGVEIGAFHTAGDLERGIQLAEQLIQQKNPVVRGH